MMFELDKLVRENIKSLKPYSSARSEFKGEASVFLDANENSYGSPLDESFNRYPDPLQWELKSSLEKIKNISLGNIFIGNGSDEAIDLAFRIFCSPGKDNVIICPPTYGMYEVSANINDVEIKKVNLKNNFQLDVDGIIEAVDANTKLLFICSPNNPTGNSMNRKDIERLINNFPGLVIIDEAYSDFSTETSFVPDVKNYSNLIVMQTLSKAWGLASLRLGLAFASKEIIDLFNKVKPPYNVNKASQQLALKALQNKKQVNEWVKLMIEQRDLLLKNLVTFCFVEKVYESDANFLLIKVDDAKALYKYLTENKIVVRDRSKEVMCDNCLRITVGTADENIGLLEVLKKYKA
jgi:histidinol-phosphate aminotransferase